MIKKITECWGGGERAYTPYFLVVQLVSVSGKEFHNFMVGYGCITIIFMVQMCLYFVVFLTFG